MTHLINPSLESRLSKMQVMSIASSLHHNERGIKAMLAQMNRADNPRIAYNAAWVLSHLPMEDKRIYLLPRYAELVDMATSATPCSHRRLTLSILADLSTDEVNGTLLDYCLMHLADTQESDSTRAVMIKLAARMCKSYPELCGELILCLDMMTQDSSPSIAAAKRNALRIIQKRDAEYGTV